MLPRLLSTSTAAVVGTGGRAQDVVSDQGYEAGGSIDGGRDVGGGTHGRAARQQRQPRKGGGGSSEGEAAPKRRKLTNDCGDEWDEDEEFEAIILDSKVSEGQAVDGFKKGMKMYRIAWPGYSAAASTWEPRVNVGTELIAEYEEGLRLQAELQAEEAAELEDDEEEDGETEEAEVEMETEEVEPEEAEREEATGVKDGLQLLEVVRVWKHHVYGGARAGSLRNVYVGIEWSDGSKTQGGVEPSEPLACTESGRAALLAYVATSKGKGIAKYLPSV